MASDAEVRELVEKMASERSGLIEICRGIDEAAAEVRRPDRDGEDGWSVKEQLSHLAQMDAAYRAWVERALVEDRPNLKGTAPDTVVYPLEQAHEATVDEHLQEMARQRQRTLELIERLNLDDYERTAIQDNFGELTVMQWLRSYYRHDRMHRAQIEGRPSDYQPRFLRGEPDQRRR